MDPITIGIYAVVGLAVLIYLLANTHFINEYERAVRFRMGRAVEGLVSAGPTLVMAPITRLVRVSMRIRVLEIAKQDAITKDNVSLSVSAAAYYKVVDVRKFVLAFGITEDYDEVVPQVSQVAQTTLRALIGEFDLNTLLSESQKTAERLRELIDAATEVWGIQVTSVEIRSVDLPEGMRRAMGQAAEAQREAAAKVIAAEGELKASATLAEAAEKLSGNHGAMELRRLQTLAEIAVEQNSTIVFPFPVELLRK